MPFEVTVRRRGRVIKHVKKNVKTVITDEGTNYVHKRPRGRLRKTKFIMALGEPRVSRNRERRKNVIKTMFPFEPYTKNGIPQCVECGAVMEYRGAGEYGAVWSCPKGHGQTEE